MKISIFGTGYAGLFTGVCLAELGHQVMRMVVDLGKVEGLQHGEIPIYERALEELVTNNVAACKLQFTAGLATTICKTDLLFIAISTSSDENGSADLSHALEVDTNIGKLMDGE